MPQANAYFDYYHGITFHVADGYRIVLETEHFYISLGVDGVTLDEKTVPVKSYERPGEWLLPFWQKNGVDPEEPPWLGVEHTLFCGERLLEVAEDGGDFVLTFDDFTMRIVPHESGDDIYSFHCANHWSALHIYGCERLLKKPCACGGIGELFVDFKDDYFVRCSKCKRATWVQMDAQDAIDEWNGGNLEWDASDITIE
ncbi:MAG: hypothetical protein IJT18_08300 [Oscillospiraceae bacterium]|nr:hypothetical protein [Oscillospiraceae bacterium]